MGRLLLLGFVGIRRRSLTTGFSRNARGTGSWLDWPEFAARLKILSDIFLRLIKVIVAPLILGTLITAWPDMAISAKSAGSAGKACSILK